MSTAPRPAAYGVTCRSRACSSTTTRSGSPCSTATTTVASRPGRAAHFMSSTTSPTTRWATATGSVTATRTRGLATPIISMARSRTTTSTTLRGAKPRIWRAPWSNCAAFQEIISYQNTFFNNTVYTFYTGSRRQAPEAGRNKYLGNLWVGIGQYVFRHADPAKSAAEGNAKDAGPAKEHFALESDAYGRNVFYDTAEMGVLEPSGRWLRTFDDFKSALVKHRSLLSELGTVSQASPLREPSKGDFRPADGSAAAAQGVKVFVPWALSGVVGEWSFCRPGDDPANLTDEHWYMTDYHVSRDTYYERPMYQIGRAACRERG